MKYKMINLFLALSLFLSTSVMADSNNWSSEKTTRGATWTQFTADILGSGFFATYVAFNPSVLSKKSSALGDLNVPRNHMWAKHLASIFGLVGLVSQGVNLVSGGLTWRDVHDNGNTSNKHGDAFEGGYWSNVAGAAVETTGLILHYAAPKPIGFFVGAGGAAVATVGAMVEGIGLSEDSSKN